MSCIQRYVKNSCGVRSLPVMPVFSRPQTVERNICCAAIDTFQGISSTDDAAPSHVADVAQLVVSTATNGVFCYQVLFQCWRVLVLIVS